MRRFVIFALPRSRTAWLSRFLSYGDWVCGHDELRHMRSLDDIRTWLSQECVGSIETAAAPFWRLLEQLAPGTRVITIRRPVSEVLDSFLAVPGLTFDRDELLSLLTYLDAKLDQIEARVPGVLSVRYADLAREEVCARLFEHCLPYSHDPVRWWSMAATNVQIDLRAMARHAQAFLPSLKRLASQAKHRILADLAVRAPVSDDAITIQTESFDSWVRDAQALFDAHLVEVGECPGDWQRKNLALMAQLDQIGAMQITTARSNGRMFGYLMTIIAPSLAASGRTVATNTTFYADHAYPGLGMKLQRASLRLLLERGVDEVVWEAGKRGSGPRLGSLYRRLGAVEHGQTYRLELSENV